jgi:hypothetical protein
VGGGLGFYTVDNVNSVFYIFSAWTAMIMDMLKKMYDEGDDDIKRTISKSLAESRSRPPA